MAENIFFFPILPYLSNPTYAPIASLLEGRERIYIDTSSYSNGNLSLTKEDLADLKKQFDHVYELGKNINVDVKNILSEVKKYRLIIRELKEICKRHNPVAFVFPTDIAFELRAVQAHFSMIPRIVIQPGFKRIVPRKEYGLKHKAKFLFFKYILKVPLFRWTPMFGEQDRDAHYLFWTPKWLKAVNKAHSKHIYFMDGVPAKPLLADNKNDSKQALKNQILRSASTPLKVVTILLNKRISIGEDYYKEYAEFYTHVIRHFPNYHFVLKVHPLEDRAFSESLYQIGSITNATLIFNEFRLSELLSISDVMITQWSSAIYDALCNDIPTVLVNPNNHHDMHSWFVGDYPHIATSKEKLIKLVETSISNKAAFLDQTSEFQSLSFGIKQSEGAHKAAQIIQSIIQR